MIIERSQEVMSTLVGEEVVLIHVERGFYFGIEKTGRAIWDLLETHRTLDEVCSALEDKYEVASPALLRDETEAYLRLLADEGLVLIR